MNLDNDLDNNSDKSSVIKQSSMTSSDLDSRPKPGSGNHTEWKGSRSSTTTSGTQTPKSSAQKWLQANHDPNANIYAISSGISLADLNHDGDYRLLIGDIGFDRVPKLKIYHGTFLQTENLLVDIPCGVVVVHNEKIEQNAAVVVASGSYLFVYRNLKPFYKFSLPPLETNRNELEAWTRFKESKINLSTLEEILNNLRLEIGRRHLTSRSQTFLNLPPEMKLPFAENYKNQALKKMNVITCISTLKKTVSETNAPSCLILGTENQDVYILEIEAFTILSKASLPSVPVFIEASGLFDVEYRILFACRDAHIYLIKRGSDTGRLCIQLNSQPVGLCCIGSNIYVSTMDQALSIFTNKGNRIWNMKQPACITTMEAIFLERQGLHIVAVALNNKQIIFYNDRKCVDILHMDEMIVAMKFGRFGREDNTLILITKSGSLIVKILKRTAKFTIQDEEQRSLTTGILGNIGPKLIVPKKTKLFVDQTMREREQYLVIHKTFEHELMRLKLNTARTYAKAFKLSLNPISHNSSDSIKVSAKVIGLGPTFQVSLELQNNADSFLTNLLMVFDYSEQIYRLSQNAIRIASLLSNHIYRYTNRVECISQLNLSDTIKIYILYEKEEIPLVTAVINMPKSELENEPQQEYS